MAHDVRIVIACPDRPGVLAAIAARLFDLGANLADTSFAVLGEEAEFIAICELPDEVSANDVEAELAALPALATASVSVAPYTLGARRAAIGQVTHVVDVNGVDRPGLVARLAEAFAEFDANIVRMSAERVSGGMQGQYLIRFEVWLPGERAQACLATVDNTAQALGLTCAARPR